MVQQKRYGHLGLASLATIILVVGFAAGYWLNNDSQANSAPVFINADGASSGEFLSLASGWYDSGEASECLFALDHMTGTLFCWIFDPRSGARIAQFEVNIKADFGTDGKASDLDLNMVTGRIDFAGHSGRDQPADTIVYVSEGNSGTIAAYSFQYNNTAVNSSTPQSGALTRLDIWQTRDSSMQRDQ